jgi:hypothetical protein
VKDFAGHITGFDSPAVPGRRDSIQLADFAFSTSEKFTFKENANKQKGVLTITEGAMRASLTLFGQFVAAGFHLATNYAGGTAITYSEPSTEHVPQLTAHG